MVVHKTSVFSPDELRGARGALVDIPVTELVTLRSGDFRVVRHGSYPPDRGSVFRVADASYLFTTGFVAVRTRIPDHTSRFRWSSSVSKGIPMSRRTRFSR